MFRLILSAVLLLLGVGLAGGGAWLVWLDGSPFYLMLGLATVVTSGLLFARRPAALWLYAVILVATLAWSIWEVGFDWWALSARGSLLVVVGLIMLLPPVVRSLHAAGAPRRRYGTSAGALALALLLSGVIGVYSMTQDPHDLDGAFPAERMNATGETAAAEVPDGEWQSYGRTAYGQRYSPLEQITPRGPIITGGGVAFLSGTLDYYVRGYDLQTGKEIWRDRLPAGGQATPATYLGADGRQYLVVVAGGHGSTGTKAGDSIIAYALPE